MAKATSEQLELTDQELAIPTGYEQQFFDVLGLTAGPEAYLRIPQ